MYSKVHEYFEIHVPGQMDNDWLPYSMENPYRSELANVIDRFSVVKRKTFMLK